MPNNPLLIGIDGGATEVKAHEVTCARWAQADGFSLGDASASRKYARLINFEPVPVAEQLRQRDAGAIDLSAAEREQGGHWTAAAAECVVDIAKASPGRPVLAGMGMPGLKTPDGRGINVINNGPRIPDFLEQLEQRVRGAGIEFAAPIAALGSDADYCGLGEQYAEVGHFREVEHAYYMGGGTGIADAMKLRGELVPFDAAKPWIQKSWQMASYLGPTFEKLVSARALNETYWALRGFSAVRLDPAGGEELPPRYPELSAAAGDPLARSHMQTAALVTAELLFERLHTIYAGRQPVAHRGPAYSALEPAHPYRGVLLDRMILGQRLGQIYSNPELGDAFAPLVRAVLGELIHATGDARLIAHCLVGRDLRWGFLQGSTLRSAPALGAAVAAVKARV